MLARQILNMLHKISRQLEEISSAQQEIKEEIYLLHVEFSEFQESTLKNLETRFSKSTIDPLLN